MFNQDNLVKTGGACIILGGKIYRGFIPEKKNKLLKITKINDNHNEFKYLHLVRKINNYSQYYTIPDEKEYILHSSDSFYSLLKSIVNHHDINIFYGPLSCFYMDYAGNTDLLDTFIALRDNCDYRFWYSYKTILDFIKIIMNSLKYLHEKQLCHLDIKPENIMVNTRTRRFKIIDFGFCSVEPFNDYVNNIRGTPSYFPKHFEGEIPTPWLPEIYANDVIMINGAVPFVMNRKLVYKIDSYCLGRVLYFLRHVYTDNLIACCFPCKTCKTIKKIDNIIQELLENDINKRLTVSQCLTKYF